MISRRVRSAIAGLPLLLVAGCGGGGGSQTTPTIPAPPATPTPAPTPTPTPTPAPTPAPTPTPTPTPTPAPAPTPTPTPAPTPTPTPTGTPLGSLNGGTNDTAEYRNSAGLVQANALAAYDAGYTGRGVTAAIVDGGIDTSNAEFAGRISAASADVAGNGSIKDEGGHGTAVASVLGAARDGSAAEGIAYGTTLLILRTDEPGSCAKGDCEHDDPAIAAGIDIAVRERARVINISLGGSAATPVLLRAIDRATAAGIVVVIAAGNDTATEPDPFALIANDDTVARGLVIIAGATEQNGTIATFSNQAGSGAGHYLAAAGRRLLAYGKDGTQALYSGTSFSAPLISGAIALLAQAFPTLTGAQIVQILYDTAADGGAAGTDGVYGRGVLNLAAAFRPRGTTALAGTAVPVSLTQNGVTSAAMGDAATQHDAGRAAVILDGYGRAYALNLAATIGRAPLPLRLAPQLAGERRTLGGATPDGNTIVVLTIARDGAAARLTPLTLDAREADAARATAGYAATRIDAHTAAAIGFATSGAALADRLSGDDEAPFLIADRPAAAAGFAARTGQSLALRRAFGRLALTMTAEAGDTRVRLTPDGAANPQYRRSAYTQAGIAAERAFGMLMLRGGVGRLIERRTVLGARFDAGLGTGATSDFVDLGASLAPGGGWRLDARWRAGWTRGQAGAIARDGARLATRAFAIDVMKDRMFGRDDRIALRIAQPLRVASGGIALTLPTGYDYETGVAVMQLTPLGLAPRGRELDVEAAWQRPFAGGWLGTNLFWRRDPGNVAAIPDDRGVALRFTLGL